MKSLRSTEHQKLIALLTSARSKAGMTQQQLAERLGKPQSYVAKYEGGERRVDVVEFLAIAQILIYVGAIVMLFVFVIMLTADIQDRAIRQVNQQVMISGISAAGFLFTITKIIKGSLWQGSPPTAGRATPADPSAVCHAGANKRPCEKQDKADALSNKQIC